MDLLYVLERSASLACRKCTSGQSAKWACSSLSSLMYNMSCRGVCAWMHMGVHLRVCACHH
eukprot:1091033-Pelagomonas_calceolata.AAC.1